MDSAQLERLKEALSKHYQFEGELGEGAYAKVFLARDLRLERYVAIKVLNIDPNSEQSEIRFLREVRFLARLQHPNIVPIHDSGHCENLLYYVMPYIRGESLRERIGRERQLSIADSARIAAEICDAVECAHSAGVIHRDIKPENILFSASHAMLADFGVARAIHSSQSRKITRPGFGSPGTPAYMSPEQLLGDQGVDTRADIYALGCVLFEMLTGHAPFEGEGGFVMRFTEAPPSVLAKRKDVPLALDSIISKALARAPQERYGSASEMGQALGTVLLGRTEPQEPKAEPIPAEIVAPGPDEVPSPSHFEWLRWAKAASLVIVAVLLLSAGSVLVSKWASASSSDEATPKLDPRNVAILYFDDRSPGKTVSHIANGLTEDLIDALSEVRALHVISPNGVRVFQGRAVPLNTLARQLNVGSLVAGSVESSGDFFRVTVRLIDAATGQQLQSHTLQQRIDKLFDLQDSLVTDVALFLREHLGREIRVREKRSGTKSVLAWEAAQQGEEAAQRGSELTHAGDDKDAVSLLLRADSLYRRASSLDANWIVPWVDRGLLAYAFAFISPNFVPTSADVAPSRPNNPDSLIVYWLHRGITFSDSALRRIPDAPEALALRGSLRYRLALFSPNTRADTLLPLSEADLRMALSTRPDFANAWYELGDLYYQQGRFVEAVRASRTAFETDAFLSEMRGVLATLFYASLHAEDFTAARSWCQMGLRRFPGDPRLADCELGLLGRTSNRKEDAKRAWALVDSVERGDSIGMLAPMWAYRRMMVAAVLARSGMKDSALAVVHRTRNDLPRHTDSSDPGWDEAYVYLILGDHDSAVRVLGTRLAAEPYERPFVARSPWYRALRADSRFRALIQT